MITTIVQFKLPTPITREEAQLHFLDVAPQFHEVPGLIRKYFLLSKDGGTMGGAYLWKTREDAERFYDRTFSQRITERFGCEPSITYFESPVVIDNFIGAIISTH